jgi:hypothetical protein
MSLTLDILNVLKDSRQGMTYYEIFKKIGYYEDPQGFRVNISQMITRGTVRTDGKRLCDSCNTPHMVYRITDHGRIYSESGLYPIGRMKPESFKEKELA